VQFTVFAGVEERDIGVGALAPPFFALIDFAGVEGFGVDVDADGALRVLREIDNLVNGFAGIDVGGVSGVHLDHLGGNQVAGRAGGVAMIDAVVLHAQAANGDNHPAILVAMVVDAAGLADFPADGHAFEKGVFENQIAGVVAFGEIAIFCEAFSLDVVV